VANLWKLLDAVDGSEIQQSALKTCENQLQPVSQISSIKTMNWFLNLRFVGVPHQQLKNYLPCYPKHNLEICPKKTRRGATWHIMTYFEIPIIYNGSDSLSQHAKMCRPPNIAPTDESGIDCPNPKSWILSMKI